MPYRDYFGPEYDEHEYFDNSVSKECKFCGAENLWWRQFGYKWKLIEEDGSVHVCPPNEKDLLAFPPL